MIVVKNITKHIQGHQLLDDVSFCVPQGHAIGIVGPNGASKSVTLRATTLVDPPTTGTVRIGEFSYSFPSPQKFTPPWPRLSVVFQQLFLWPNLTLRQNAMLSGVANRSDKSGRRFDDLVNLFQLGSAIDRYPNEVSLGQRQLAAIIRALVVAPAPQWLALDECTSALDVEQTNRVLELLKRLKKEENLTIIFVSHLLGFAAALADQVLFMEGGKVLESGGPEILAHPRSARMRRFVQLVEPLAENGRNSGAAGEAARNQ